MISDNWNVVQFPLLLDVVQSVRCHLWTDQLFLI